MRCVTVLLLVSVLCIAALVAGVAAIHCPHLNGRPCAAKAGCGCPNTGVCPCGDSCICGDGCKGKKGGCCKPD